MMVLACCLLPFAGLKHSQRGLFETLGVMVRLWHAFSQFEMHIGARVHWPIGPICSGMDMSQMLMCAHTVQNGSPGRLVTRSGQPRQNYFQPDMVSQRARAPSAICLTG